MLTAMNTNLDTSIFGIVNGSRGSPAPPSSDLLLTKSQRSLIVKSLQLSWKILTNSLKANSSGVSFSAFSGFNEMFHSFVATDLPTSTLTPTYYFDLIHMYFPLQLGCNFLLSVARLSTPVCRCFLQ